MNPIRCILFGAGAVGMATAKLLAQKGIRPVAVYGRTTHVGRDLGELAGPALNGVIVRPVSEFRAERGTADVALFCTTGRPKDLLIEARQCLLAGTNVLTIAEGAFFPWTYDPTTADVLHRAAVEGGATLSASGSQDCAMLHLTAAATGLAADARRISFHMFSDFTPLGSGSTGRMQIGCDPQEFNRDISPSSQGGTIMSTTGQIVEALAAMLRLGPVALSHALDPVTAQSTVAFPARGLVVAPGMVSGMVETVIGQTSAGVEIVGKLTAKLFEDGDVETFTCEIDGTMPFTLTLSPTFGLEGTAASLINRIPDIMAAESGYVTADRLAAPRLRVPATFLQ